MNRGLETDFLQRLGIINSFSLAPIRFLACNFSVKIEELHVYFWLGQKNPDKRIENVRSQVQSVKAYFFKKPLTTQKHSK